MLIAIVVEGRKLVRATQHLWQRAAAATAAVFAAGGWSMLCRGRALLCAWDGPGPKKSDAFITCPALDCGATSARHRESDTIARHVTCYLPYARFAGTAATEARLR